MPAANDTTAPKPYVFVLMPFDKAFKDAYMYGIKGAAEDVGAYAERLDEQIFTEGMLERIFTQISKADLLVADMTGRNPNVFYEVGYAHALGKIVLLLTQDAGDIPFDLQHRQHIVYGGSIETLREQLCPQLQWAIGESRRRTKPGASERFSVRIYAVEVPRDGSGQKVPTVEGTTPELSFALPIQIRNESVDTMLTITHVYLFCAPDAPVVPCTYSTYQSYTPSTLLMGPGPYTQFSGRRPTALDSFEANPLDAADGLSKEFRLPLSFTNVPTGAVEAAYLDFMFREGARLVDGLYRVRVHTASLYQDYTFRMRIHLETQNDQTKTKGQDKPG